MSDATALIIHSDPAVRQRLHEALAEERYQVIEAARGEIALELARRVVVDCILLEHHSAYFDGLELVRALRADAATAAVPVIVVAKDAADAPRFANVTAQFVPSEAAAPVLEAVQRFRLPPHRPLPRHILLVDEDLEFSQAGEAALQQAGHLVTVCGSGLEALKHLRHHHPHAVIVGDQLPEGSARWFLELLKSECRAEQTPPVIWVGYAPPPEREQAEGGASGVVRFLTKPLPPPQLVAAVNQLFAGAP